MGITPFMGGVPRVAERAGPARARELVMTGDLYPAETMRQWGVINRVAPLVELADQTRQLAEGLAAGPDSGHGRHQADRASAGRRGHPRGG